jgi:hypothetical protein
MAAADVAGALRRDGGGLDPVAGGLQGQGGVQDDLVTGLAPVVQGEVEVLDLHGDPGDVGGQHLEGLLEQLLAGLVAVEDDDSLGLGGHELRW